MFKSRFVLIIFALLLPALSGGDLSAAPSDAQILCKEFVQKLGNRAIAVINTPGISDEEVTKKFTEIVKENFKTDKMTQFALGRYGNKIKPDQKEEFVRCFINMLVKLYASNFKEYKDAKFSVVGLKQTTDRHYLVTSKVFVPGKREIKIIWGVYEDVGQYKIYDAVTEGV
ncbi:MAG: ABC transporter substrate-binding protein, partial [Holosporaceae bacterium]|nr:ABC transporter substrate-binding protein [Holosporaceae bacterium]